MRIFSGQYKGRLLSVPKGEMTRPTTGRLREALFNICRGSLAEARFLDLFAGSGAMGLEALSQGAAFATFVDSHRECIRCIKTNVETLGVERQTELLLGDVFEMIDRLAARKKKYDLIFADPPYERSENGELLSHTLLARLDELIDKGQSLLTDRGVVFMEEAGRALAGIQSFKHLQLKSARKMGRSALQQYEVNR